MNTIKWTTDAEIVAAVKAFCDKYPSLETARADPKAFTAAAASLPIPQGVSLSAVAKMFETGKEKAHMKGLAL